MDFVGRRLIFRHPLRHDSACRIELTFWRYFDGVSEPPSVIESGVFGVPWAFVGCRRPHVASGHRPACLTGAFRGADTPRARPVANPERRMPGRRPHPRRGWQTVAGGCAKRHPRKSEQCGAHPGGVPEAHRRDRPALAPLRGAWGWSPGIRGYRFAQPPATIWQPSGLRPGGGRRRWDGHLGW